MSYSLMRRGEKPEWTSEHSPRKYHFLPLSEQLKTRLVCAFFPCQLQGPLGDSSPGRERERKRLPWGEELPRASESLFTTSCACYFHQNRAQCFSSPLVFLCFWQEVVIVKHQVPLCLTEQWKKRKKDGHSQKMLTLRPTECWHFKCSSHQEANTKYIFNLLLILKDNFTFVCYTISQVHMPRKFMSEKT